MWSKKCWLLKTFGPKDNLRSKIFWLQRIFGLKKVWVHKNFKSKKILGSRDIFGVLLGLSKEHICPRRPLTEGTNVQRDKCPKNKCPKGQMSKEQLSKETFV